MQNRQRHYLDYNATAPIRVAVIERMSEVMQTVGNPSSVHSSGRAARGVVEAARANIAALVGARARDVVFTSGGTEANNAALRATGAKRLIVSAVEHDCTLAAAKVSGLDVKQLPVDSQGIADMAVLAELLADGGDGVLVSVMLANNETGVIEPVAEAAAIVKEAGARLHVDAAQACGKIDVDFGHLGADYLSLSGHKFGGPQGTGALVLAPTVPLAPLITGGGQELGRRSGTENVAGLAGLGVAADCALAGLADAPQLARMRDQLEAGVQNLWDGVQVLSQSAERLPNTSCLLLPGLKGETQVMHMDLNGVEVSSGSACSSGKVKQSHVLTAMGVADDLAGNSMRVSLGYGSQERDVDAFLTAYASLAERARDRVQS